jgi:hypothetical protein
VIAQLAEIYPDTWGSVPSGLMAYASGGINSIGAICGNFNAAEWLLTLVQASGTAKDNFLRFFENTYLPTNDCYLDYRSGDPATAWSPVAGIVWGVPLNVALPAAGQLPIPMNNAPKVKTTTTTCHGAHTKWKVGATAWLNKYGANMNRDRCGKTTYDSAKYVAKLINDWATGAAITATLDPSVAGCKTAGCHDVNPPTGVGGKMMCAPCHDGAEAVTPGHGY